MSLRLAVLLMILVGSSVPAFATDKCGSFSFTNQFHETLYIESQSSSADFCYQNLPGRVLPGQAVSIPIAVGHQPYVSIHTDASLAKIKADYFLQLHFSKDGEYAFNNELNTQALSWNPDHEDLAFCSDLRYDLLSGKCL